MEPPITQVPAPVPPATTTTVQLFEASAQKGAATGINGQAAYSGPDETVFTLTFSDPFSGPNDCTLSASGTPRNYRYSSTFNQGTVCSFDCTITYDGGQ